MIFDPLYLSILLVAGAFSMWASWLTKSTFNKGQEVSLRNGLSGKDIAEAILRQKGIYDVQVVPVEGFLSDHYNPSTKTLALSPPVYYGTSASAAGVAAHEVGHAIQHAESYAFLGMRSALVPLANIGGNFAPWIIIAGIALGAASGLGHMITLIGIVLFAASTLFTVVTLPVEYDASHRAKVCLDQMGLINGEEAKWVSKVLGAAGLTYVAAAASSVMMLAYWIFKSGLLGRRED